MSWNSGIFTRSNGTYDGSSVWASDESGGFDIESSRHDTHDQDLADGINDCLHKGGQNSPTAHLNWINSQLYGVTSGSANAQSVSLPYAPSSYYTGMVVRAKIGSDLTNTGGLTLNVNGLGVKDVKDQLGFDLTGNDVIAGRIYLLIYDGTEFRVFGHAAKQTWTPSYGASGGSTHFVSITTDKAIYYDCGTHVDFEVTARGTLSGSNVYFTVDLPIAGSVGGGISGFGYDPGGFQRPAIAWISSANEVRISKPDFSILPVGDNTGFGISGRYRKA